MPLLLRHTLEPCEGVLGIWEIAEDEAFFRARLALTPAEQAQLDAIKGRKRTEWLAVRHLIHLLSEREVRGAILKDACGKPHLEGSTWHISISHSHARAAAIASPLPVGVDIQYIVPRIERIAHKFLRPEEQEALDDDHRIAHMHVYWGAKESLYKAWGRRQLDFRAHLWLEPFPFLPEGGHTTGHIEKDGRRLDFCVYYRLLDAYMLTWAVLDAPQTPAP